MCLANRNAGFYVTFSTRDSIYLFLPFLDTFDKKRGRVARPVKFPATDAEVVKSNVGN